MSVTDQQATHARSGQQPICEVTRYLQEALSGRTTAVIAGVRDGTLVEQWSSGERVPQPESEQRLRDAYRVAQFLSELEDPYTVRMWFRGSNPLLGDRSPAMVIRDDPAEVLLAARAFLANG